MAIVNLKKWKHIKVESLWLENEDYPKILGIFALTIDFFKYINTIFL